MKRIKRALISVSDKNNLKSLLNCLRKYKIKIISTGGTYNKIRRLGFKCQEVSDYTKSPEILNGRVKTLNPKIHAGILSKRKKQSNINFVYIRIKIDIPEASEINFYFVSASSAFLAVFT